MVKQASTMVELGTTAPPFYLPDATTGQLIGLPVTSEAVVIMFICNHCPYVKHVNQQLTLLARDYQPQGVSFIAINSNDATQYPEDSVENMKLTAKRENYPFPYLIDEEQTVAKAYQAACTPDFFIYDRQLKLIYRGQLDDARPGNQLPVSGDSIREALTAHLTHKPISASQKPSLGCSIKWK